MKKGCARAVICLLLSALSACSVTKYVPEQSYLLDKVEVRCADKELNEVDLRQYIHQTDNSKWFSLFKVSLGTYSLSGRDTTKWINRTLRNIGESPVIYDTLEAQLSCRDLQTAMWNMGYMDARVSTEARFKGKKASVVYTIEPGEPMYIGDVRYEIADDSIAAFLNVMPWKGNERATAARNYSSIKGATLARGQRFTVERLDEERKRITRLLNNNGYYRFNKEFISFYVDTLDGSNYADVTLRLSPYRANSNARSALHPCYTINSVRYDSGDEGSATSIRESVLRENTRITPGTRYSAADVQRTYNRMGSLAAVRYTNIRFAEAADTLSLDCTVQVGTGKPHSISFQPEGTNTAGDLGAAVSLTYQNRNIFHGAETFSVSLRGAFEAITGLEGYQNHDYMEYSAETSLLFPRMIAPFVSRRFRKNTQATSELSLSFNTQNRPEFHRRVLSAAWRYRWSNRNRRANFRLDIIDVDYVYMPWISAKFKQEYLDSVSNRNAILKYNYEDLLIMKIGASMTYNDGINAVKVNVETAGNALYAINNMLGSRKNSDGQYSLFNIAYAQYAKIDLDYTRLLLLGEKSHIAAHVGLGVAYPYGNSTILPFEKRYFSGGANSVRGWSVRGLGPGKFKGSDGNIDFINQTGDIKLDVNIEYRAPLFWKFYGAAFIDAGNIWTLRAYEEQPGGQFRFNSFYEQIAVGYGLGLRMNFDYFILRFDMGMKAINPAYDSQQEHYAVFHPDLSRDFAFHFAVGLPF